MDLSPLDLQTTGALASVAGLLPSFIQWFRSMYCAKKTKKKEKVKEIIDQYIEWLHRQRNDELLNKLSGSQQALSELHNLVKQLLAKSKGDLELVLARLDGIEGKIDLLSPGALRAKPSVKECRATLRIHHSRNRSNDAEALVVNSGEKSCYITKMRLLSDVFDLETVRISFDREVAYGISGRGDETPLQLNGNEEKRVYMRTQELVEQYKGQLPNTVKVYIEFDSKQLIKTLTKDVGRSVYLFK